MVSGRTGALIASDSGFRHYGDRVARSLMLELKRAGVLLKNSVLAGHWPWHLVC